MRIPIAIYTAIEGYAWQPGTELSIEFLNEAKRAIGKFPDSSGEGLPFGGAVLVRDKLVIFRYHKARNIDSFGRDALYVVLAALPRAEAWKVNLKVLLESSTFAVPTKPIPPLTVDYDGPPSASCPYGFGHEWSQDVDFIESLAWLGQFVAQASGTVSLTCSPATEHLPRLALRFVPPPPPPLPPPPPRFHELVKRTEMTKVSIVGVEGSGKTVLMAVLGDKYKLPDANGLSLKPNNFETFSYVASQMAVLQGQAWPQATEPDIMQTLGWTLQRTDAKGDVTPIGEVPCLDFAGEIYRYAFGPYTADQIKATPKGDLTTPVNHLREHVKSSQCLIVLVNLAHVIDGDMSDERVQEAVWLTQRIVDFAKEAKIPRVALALTQCDRYRAEIAECGGVTGTMRKYLPHVAVAFPRLKVFEVSAVGDVKPSVNKTAVPREDAKPVGLEDLMSFMVGVRRPVWNGLIGKAVAGLGLAAVLVGSTVWGCVAYQHRQRTESEACTALKQQLADAQKQATNAVSRADNAERKLADAQKQAANAVSRADKVERKLADAQKQAANAASRADNAERKLADAQKQAANAVSRADNAERKLAATRRESTSAFAYKVIDLEDGTVSHLNAVPSGGWTDEYKTRKLVLRRIEPGNFTMGSPPSEEGRDTDEQQHSVTLTKPYYMGVFEVTQGQWERVMGGTVFDQAKKEYPNDDPQNWCGERVKDRPIYWVNWNESVEFCGKVSRQCHIASRLPTEAEWEYACRAGSETALPGVDGFHIVGERNAPALDGIAWYGGNSSEGYVGRGWDTSGWPEKQYQGGHAGPRSVGTRRVNAWGLYDMIGNVWEWCDDWYDSGYYAKSPAVDPPGPNSSSGENRVSRGGSWSSLARFCRSAYRIRDTPGYRSNNLGFRLWCSAGPYE